MSMIITGHRTAIVEVVDTRIEERKDGLVTLVTVKRIKDAGAAPAGRIWSQLEWKQSYDIAFGAVRYDRHADFAIMTREQFDGRTVSAS